MAAGLGTLRSDAHLGLSPDLGPDVLAGKMGVQNGTQRCPRVQRMNMRWAECSPAAGPRQQPVRSGRPAASPSSLCRSHGEAKPAAQGPRLPVHSLTLQPSHDPHPRSAKPRPPCTCAAGPAPSPTLLFLAGGSPRGPPRGTGRGCGYRQQPAPPLTPGLGLCRARLPGASAESHEPSTNRP